MSDKVKLAGDPAGAIDPSERGLRRRDLLRSGASLLAASALTTGITTTVTRTAIAQAATGKPNVLCIWGDDIGTWNISHNNRGMMGYQTPNIDRIANEGVSFTDYYGQQSCTAGRAAFIGGNVPVRTGMTKVGLPGVKEGWQKTDVTMATVMKSQGYATGHFGKNHQGDRDEHLPTQTTYNDWFLDHVFVIVPIQALAAKFLQTMKDYPPSQTPGSFNLSKIEEGPEDRNGELTERHSAAIHMQRSLQAISEQEQLPDQPPFPNMVRIPAGTFTMGSDRHYAEEAPAHQVSVGGFWIDRFTVTNEEFHRFVAATGHITLAERPPNPADYPGAKPEMLGAASIVFQKAPRAVSLKDRYNWWTYVPGANWRHPSGPGSSIEGAEKHPVVQVGFEDAEAYANWAGKELPTEAEWEFAARGGLEGAEFVWGDAFEPDGKSMANTWQGEFPWQNLQTDGYEGIAPVGCFPANGYGLHDMAGNVWEWTTDWYQDHNKIQHACCTLDNPRGGNQAGSFDPNMSHIPIPRRVMKGGSYLCAPSYCRRYRPAARMAQPIDTATCHLGFRCVLRSPAGHDRKQSFPD